MADLPAQDSVTLTAAAAPVNAAIIVYVLFAVAAVGTAAHGLVVFAPLVGVAGIVGVVIAYVKRGEAQGTWVASHLTWLIRTFWWSLGWSAIGALAFVTLIGIPVAVAIFFATSIWGLYRVIRGILLFKDNQPIPGV